jgi:hypothetical protein
MKQPDRTAITEAVRNGDLPTGALALYARWWQLETWLRSLAYVELRAKFGMSWVNELALAATIRQERDQSRIASRVVV